MCFKTCVFFKVVGKKVTKPQKILGLAEKGD
jgi:hypothetical protein